MSNNDEFETTFPKDGYLEAFWEVKSSKNIQDIFSFLLSNNHEIQIFK